MEFLIKENADVSLHDCRTNRIRKEGQSITFYFPDGFYFIKDYYSDTCNGEMNCHIADKYAGNFTVYIYRKGLFGRIIRKDRTDRFIQAVNDGRFEFEFVNTYRSYHDILFKGYIWRHKKPWWRECEINIRTDEITYTWTDRYNTCQNISTSPSKKSIRLQ